MNPKVLWTAILAMLVLSISFCGKDGNSVDNSSENAYLADTAAVRAILDASGLTSLPISAVAELHIVNGLYRVIGLNLSPVKLAGSGTVSSIPANIGTLTALTNLTLDSNNISSLPAEIGLLVNMSSFSAMKNQLGSLPDSIGQCIKLQTINVSDNRLQTIPSTMINLSQLRVLDLTANLIATIPDAVAGLTANLANGGVFVDNNKICAPTSAITTWLNSYGSNWNTTQICP